MLENLGNIGEFVGGIGVVATLIYLAFQIGQNTKGLRAAAMDSSLQRLGAIEMLLIQDAEIAELVHSGNADYENLPTVDKRRYRNYVMTIFKEIENHFFKHQSKLLPHSQYAGFKFQTIHSFGRPGWRQCWNEVAPIFAPEFREFIDELILERDRDA